MKASLAFLFVVGLAAVSNGAENITSHHLIVGSRVAGDYLLLQQVVHKSSSWLAVVKKDVTFSAGNYQIITQVKALDQKTNGNGGFASLTHGGPGSRDVTVHFKSTRGHSVNFILEIYGR